MSRVEVDKIQQQCGTTLTVGGGACKTAVVDATTVTLGRCGGTVSLASGATQSGFGRTGTVDWDTSIKTGTVTAVTGKGYFVDTTLGGITVNLPAAAVGSIVAVSDYASTSASNNITVAPNGSEKINGVNDDYTIATAGLAVTLVYADATRGWKSVTGSDADATGIVPAYVVASGGSPCSGAIVCTNYKTHTFTGPGTFTVSCAGNPAGSNEISYMIVAGGGAGGRGATGSSSGGSGGGAGGFREGKTPQCTYTSSPLACTSGSNNGIAVTATGYPIAVGAGGTAAPWPANFPTLSPAAAGNGNPSTGFSLTSTAGGGGANRSQASVVSGAPGGSGGGAQGCGSGGTGNTPPVSPPQGKDGGGNPAHSSGAGGGGATVAGLAGGPANPTCIGGAGGAGETTSISATPTAYAGGGGGGTGGAVPQPAGGGAAGTGGGGAGSANDAADNTAGGCNTGGGGGGGGGSDPGSAGLNGGSGIVIVRYKFQ